MTVWLVTLAVCLVACGVGDLYVHLTPTTPGHPATHQQENPL